MNIFQNIKRSINNLIDNHNVSHNNSHKNIGYRCAPAPEEMGPSCRELQMYNTQTGEAIVTPNKVYIHVWSPEAVNRLKEAYRTLEESYPGK